MDRRSFGQDLAILLPDHLVAKLDRRPPEGRQVRTDRQHVIIPGRAQVAAAGFHHHEQPAISLDLRIRAAGRPDEFRPSAFEPDQVARMMGHPHLVGLRIPDPDLEDPWLHSSLTFALLHASIGLGLTF